MSSSIKTVGVIGAGVIGASWTALFLAKGLSVIVTDPAPGAEAKLRGYLEEYCAAVPNAICPPDECLKNYTFMSDIDPYLATIDLIQENGPERLPIKRQLIAHLDAKTPNHTLIASSSSGLPSSEFITECKNNPSRILIAHPFNPPHLVPLVEIVPHPRTSDEVIATARTFYASLDKDPVVVKQETPGFIANRLQAAVCAEAYSLVSRGVVSPEDLDKTITSGLGLRWALTGPIMTNTLGGGGDFGHFMDHLGPALRSWLDDMQEKRFDLGDGERVHALKETVNGWVEGVDLKRVERERDGLLAELVRGKVDATRAD
ncbi:hypothetical protein BO94DRAFT_519523 [Aspergillus sclerotioniger CBS 115572]|uniref:3-hydroxyacyl-CoA dehyrogenase n=1 Tax=Aspergillus sclerotioniger CBS 115572 TaxID=1450535 RepID=A0A317WC26_9EURO|nr:hypothetical protein BO94DRAFT_519523 [Aspergillus sclerotioniger CBS 115572]PWY83913.1 hypothetical protein BO94DRAFT_519523 [Aspergillus sclerotioniger CBS 115572]